MFRTAEAADAGLAAHIDSCCIDVHFIPSFLAESRLQGPAWIERDSEQFRQLHSSQERLQLWTRRKEDRVQLR